MLKEQIDDLIKESILSKQLKRTEVLRAIKNEFLVFQTAKNAKVLNDSSELDILRKMSKQRLDSIDQYTSAGRLELADAEKKELLIIQSFLPKEATPDEIAQVLRTTCINKGWLDNEELPKIPKKSMGEAIKLVRSKFTNIDNKLLSDMIKTCLV